MLCLSLFNATALAGKKKKTVVVVNTGPVLSGKQNVKASGHLKANERTVNKTVCKAGFSSLITIS